MIKPYAVKCDACHWGYVNGRQCPKCEGNGSVMVTDVDEPLKVWEAALLIGVLLMSAYLVVYGAVAIILRFHR